MTVWRFMATHTIPTGYTRTLVDYSPKVPISVAVLDDGSIVYSLYDDTNATERRTRSLYLAAATP